MASTPTQEQKESSLTNLRQMVDLLGFAAEVVAEESPAGYALRLKTDDPGRLIGRKGHYLLSLELLLNRTLRKKFNHLPWVEVNVDGYDRKRKTRGERSEVDGEQLEQMALDMAKEVKRWGKPKELGPLSARERRIVHMFLREDAEIVSESEEPEVGGRKKVVIRLADKKTV